MTKEPNARLPRAAPPSTNLPPGRGVRRREQLVAAGVELLGERGWAGVTARAVAERADTHAGLVHYHFGGLPALKKEVAALAVRRAFDPTIALLTSSTDWAAGLAAAVRASEPTTDAASARATAELITASLQDPDIGDLLRQTLADARAQLVPWLRSTGASEPEGLATLLVAALDGLLLHRIVDPALPLAEVARAADALASVSTATTSRRRTARQL
jgi:AcrR family transcriptional regulator